jgi:hypothetical protein
MRYAAIAFTLFLLGACAAVEQASNPMYSSLLSKADIAEITALVAQRSGIRRPIFQITAEDPRRDRFVVYTGHQNKIGDQFDYFTVQKLRGTWRIVSPVSHDTVKPHPERVIVTQLKHINRSNQTMQRTAGSLGSSFSMKFHPQPAAARRLASRR